MALPEYNHSCDILEKEGTSHLSPPLHFGEITPRQIFHTLRTSQEQSILTKKENNEASTIHSITELFWREFSYHLLHFFPSIIQEPFRAAFKNFPWQYRSEWMEAWQRGETGYPLVDAGMRELWATGYMHNRVRMIVASFLTKHLLIHWRSGADWFWDTLVDADIANNTVKLAMGGGISPRCCTLFPHL